MALGAKWGKEKEERSGHRRKREKEERRLGGREESDKERNGKRRTKFRGRKNIFTQRHVYPCAQ